MSFVDAAANVDFLKKRFAAMSAHHCYHGMEYTEDRATIAEWTPLVMEGRDAAEPIAATRIVTGADVDYGALTHLLVHHLQTLPRRPGALPQPRDGYHARDRRPLAGRGQGPGERRDEVRIGQVRLHRRGRRVPAAVAEERHFRRPRLRRLSGQRPLAALRHSRCRRAPPRQGLWQGGGRLAAHVGAASRHAGRRRPALPAVRPLCRLLEQVPQARLADGSVRIGQARQHRAHAVGGARTISLSPNIWSIRFCSPRAIGSPRSTNTTRRPARTTGAFRWPDSGSRSSSRT